MKKNYFFFLRKSIQRHILSITFFFSITSAVHAQQLSQEGYKLVGTSTIGYSRQGNAVAISADGNTAIVASDQDDSNVVAYGFIHVPVVL